MFYDEDLMVKSSLEVPWRIAYNQKPSKKVTLGKLCTTLNKWMDVDPKTTKPLSLRTSSVLINGMVRMYRDETDELLEDCAQLFQDLCVRKTTTDTLEQGADSDSDTVDDRSSKSTATTKGDPKSDLNGTNSDKNSDSNSDETNADLSDDTNGDENDDDYGADDERETAEFYLPRKSHISKPISRETEDNQFKKRKLDTTNNAKSYNTQSKKTTSEIIHTSKRNQPDEGHDQPQTSAKEPTNDKEVQTEKSFIRNAEERNKYRQWNLDENLPKTHLIVFDKNNRPTKVISSNINPAIERL